MELVNLPNLAGGSPLLVPVTGIAQVCMRNLFEPARCVEPSGDFICNGFVMRKAVGVRGANGLLIKLFGIEQAAFDTGDLCPHQSSAVSKILRAILRPDFKLSVMIKRCVEVPLPLVGR